MTTEFTPGQHIGDYEILSILGAGGMGKVYKVRNVISDRIEAMKILLPDLSSNQSLAERFLREIRLLATLNHPNIASLRTALTQENQLAMIMEFVEGETLSHRLARAALSTADAINYADQVLGALSYAHKQNIIHRDIKPANMMLTPDGVVKLMDVGIARSATAETTGLTSTGTTLGSLNYMPPEQVRGEVADARSDLYSFGISLYEMLTGKLPFHSDSQYSLMTAHLNVNPPPPITLRSDLPASLNEIILMAMAKDRDNRFQSAEAFRAALQSVPVSDLPASAMSSARQADIGSGTTLVDSPTPARVPTPSATPPAAAFRQTGTPFPPPQAPTVIPPPPPSPSMAPKSSSRGLWLALGSLLGVTVLVAAGVYIPRHLGTHADPGQAAPSPTKKQDLGASPSQGQSSTSPASGQTDKGSASVDQGSKTPGADDSVNASGKTAGGKSENSAGNPKPSRDGSAQIPATPPGPTAEEITKAQDEADNLNVRAATVSQSLDSLRKQQAASGYNLRADISSSQDRMNLLIAKGNAALQARNMAAAQKYFDQADAELSKIEKFLGH
jgi:serine/threonine-protein kinase